MKARGVVLPEKGQHTSEGKGGGKGGPACASTSQNLKGSYFLETSAQNFCPG